MNKILNKQKNLPVKELGENLIQALIFSSTVLKQIIKKINIEIVRRCILRLKKDNN